MNISTIIFDLGGVVLNNDWHDGNQEKFKEYTETFHISYDDMEKGWNKAWPDYSLGKMTEDEFWRVFLKYGGAKTINVDKAKTLWRKYVFENESMLSLLIKLKSKYQLGALTTISKEWLDYKSVKFQFNNIFDVIVSSGYSGLEKPDIRIYKKIIAELGVKPIQCIFVDDSKNTLPPARKLGIYPLLFVSQNTLEQDLKSLNII